MFNIKIKYKKERKENITYCTGFSVKSFQQANMLVGRLIKNTRDTMPFSNVY